MGLWRICFLVVSPLALGGFFYVCDVRGGC